MPWNWQHKDWPEFSYQREDLRGLEDRFLHESGLLVGAYQHLSLEEQGSLRIELISEEAMKTSEIEGEFLNRESLQSSIRRQMGLQADRRKVPPAEAGIAELMVSLYQTFEAPLTHEMLSDWHLMLMKARWDLQDIGRYRTHADPMQIVSGSARQAKIHFEAPPSSAIPKEMDQFIQWFNGTAPGGEHPLPALIRAGIAHLYFELLHPFEDGNGRIGRVIAEKALSQSLGQPVLLALSRSIQKHKKSYYAQLEASNQILEITDWLRYFGQTILDAQQESRAMIGFLIAKAKFYDQFGASLNERQAKVIARLFEAGPAGFEGGLSAEKYIRLTQTSRATATRDLQDLVKQSALIQTGSLKSSRYQLKLD